MNRRRIPRREFLRFTALAAGGAAALPGAPQDDPGLPRVLLIGDSISMGYTEPVRRLLRGKASVSRIPVNGGPTTNGIQNLASWLAGGRWDVIHFNWGLHDLKVDADGKRQVPIEQYEANLRELVKQLQATGAKLIWASTTPVPPGKQNPMRLASDVPIYNAVAKKIMQANGIPINDLYAFALPRAGVIQRPSNVHFTDAGYEELAGQVAAAILKALRR
ncbi:MAG TPA: SGNH/GDSL hydrolase family protein [Bryobacterales bacterium]|nr:SGNH/GDSL hydrolase family protein [Bryobacterales bacterium]